MKGHLVQTFPIMTLEEKSSSFGSISQSHLWGKGGTASSPPKPEPWVPFMRST